MSFRTFTQIWPDLLASLSLTGVGIVSMLQVVQVMLGILLSLLGIISTAIIIYKNTRKSNGQGSAVSAAGSAGQKS